MVQQYTQLLLLTFIKIQATYTYFFHLCFSKNSETRKSIILNKKRGQIQLCTIFTSAVSSFIISPSFLSFTSAIPCVTSTKDSIWHRQNQNIPQHNCPPLLSFCTLWSSSSYQLPSPQPPISASHTHTHTHWPLCLAHRGNLTPFPPDYLSIQSEFISLLVNGWPSFW